MNTLINRFATPLTTGLFIVSAVSGIALFFHWAPGAFHAMHEWLSLVLLAPFTLHVWKNWKGLLAYARRKTLVVPLAICLAMAIPFAVSGPMGGRGGNPGMRALPLLTHARLADLAPLLDTTPDALVASLQQHGYGAASPDETLDGVAAASGVPASDVLFAVMPAR